MKSECSVFRDVVIEPLVFPLLVGSFSKKILLASSRKEQLVPLEHHLYSSVEMGFHSLTLFS